MKSYGFNFDTSYSHLPMELWSVALPDQAHRPECVIANKPLAHAMGLTLDTLSSEEMAALFSGSLIPQGTTSLSQAYAGHQFGHFTLLGDGRAHLLGEHITSDGKRLDIQFKGSGRTPYSRRGDGKAALGPMLREYLISEAMYHLGIPTTRSLAVVTTGEMVVRQSTMPGAILTRVASSHLRIGTFEYAAIQEDSSVLSALLNYTIKRHYPDLMSSANRALALLEKVIKQQISLVVHWMRVGFIHGVMNTDNIALSGETIDYGPCAFMDHFDPQTVFSSIDTHGRYAFSQQPKIMHWNLARFAEALLPLIHKDSDQALVLAQTCLQTFSERYQTQWLGMMRNKLGLLGEHEGDQLLVDDLLHWMQERKLDYTNTFLALTDSDASVGQHDQDTFFQQWQLRWQKRRGHNSPGKDHVSQRLMRDNNPCIIPRNHYVERVLDDALQGDFQPFKDFLHVLQRPYDQQEDLHLYQDVPKRGGRYQTFCGT